MATIVLNLISNPNIIQLKRAVRMSSSALAKVFKILFKFFKNKLVVIPINELFTIITMTRGLRIGVIDSLVKISRVFPWLVSTKTFHKIESRYINTFWMKILTFPPSSFSKYSLYTPARHEHRVWKFKKNFLKIQNKTEKITNFFLTQLPV